MAKFKDLTGKRFGMLTVNKRAGKDKWGHILWECICDCGGLKITMPGDLGRRIKSCGCLIHVTGKDHPTWKGGKVKVQCSRPGCNQSKMIYPSSKYLTTYCSEECRIEHRAWIKSGEENPKYKEKVKVHCSQCGKPIEIYPCMDSCYKDHFCKGTDCLPKWKSENLKGKANPNYNGGTPEKRKIRKRIAAAMRKAIRQEKAGRHWEDLVDYSLEDLIKRLKATVPDGYTWEDDFVNGNNVLHIDHITPMSAFNFESAEDMDFKRCFALKNLQLLPAIENMQKSAKIEEPFQPCMAFDSKEAVNQYNILVN